MEITFDHVIYILGILLGVGLTLIGVFFTEYIKNLNQQKKLIYALYHEILSNIMIVDGNKEIVNLTVGSKDLMPFNLKAF